MDSALAFIHGVNQYILNPVIVLMFAAAVLVFAYGIFEYFIHADSGDARATGRNHMIAGVIGMFIMVSVFGIVRLVLNTIGASASDTGINEIIK
jgi:hypothetical protein